jgi:hypothetical protein
VAFSPRCISAAEVPRGEVRLHPARSKQSATHNCPRGTTDHGLILSPPPFCLHSGTLTTTLLSPQWSGERTGSSTFDLVQRCFLLYTLPHTHQTLHLSLCLSPTDSLCVQVVEDAEEDKRMLRSMRTRVATRDGREFGRAAAKASASTPAVSGDMAYRKVCVCVLPTRVHPHRPCLATWRTARCVCVCCPPAFISLSLAASSALARPNALTPSPTADGSAQMVTNTEEKKPDFGLTKHITVGGDDDDASRMSAQKMMGSADVSLPHPPSRPWFAEVRKAVHGTALSSRGSDGVRGGAVGCSKGRWSSRAR